MDTDIKHLLIFLDDYTNIDIAKKEACIKCHSIYKLSGSREEFSKYFDQPLPTIFNALKTDFEGSPFIIYEDFLSNFIIETIKNISRIPSEILFSPKIKDLILDYNQNNKLISIASSYPKEIIEKILISSDTRKYIKKIKDYETLIKPNKTLRIMKINKETTRILKEDYRKLQ